jgi:hypothetical protein
MGGTKRGARTGRWAVAVVIVLTAALVGAWAWARFGRGRHYDGRPAGYWVEQLLHDPVRARQALRALGPDAVPALVEVVGRKRNRFWTQLEAWRSKLPRFVARRLPNHALDQLLQERAIEVLYEFGPAAAPAVPALLGVDASLNDFIGFGSAGLAHATLLQIGPAGLPYFIRALGSAEPKTRAGAASYLGHLGAEAGPGAPGLARALNDANPNVRSAAVMALEQIGPPARAASPELKTALGRDDDYFRLQIIRALWMVCGESETTIPILVKMLRDRNNPNRAGAAMMLGEMGPAAAAAAPALTDVLGEEFSYTRVKAEEALKQIKRDPRRSEGKE